MKMTVGCYNWDTVGPSIVLETLRGKDYHCITLRLKDVGPLINILETLQNCLVKCDKNVTVSMGYEREDFEKSEA